MHKFCAPRPPVCLRFRELGFSLCHLLIAVALFLPALKRGMHLFGIDTVTQNYLFYSLGFGQIRQGIIPLWLPNIFGGVPFLGSFALCPFFPTAWLMALLPFHTAFTLHYLLSNAFAGCCAYLCFRLMGFRALVALSGGIFFQLNCHFASLAYPGHIGKYPAIACFPLVIGAMHYGLLHGRPKMLLPAGTGLALQIVASHVQIYYYTAAVCCAYALFHFLFFAELRNRRFLLHAAILLGGSLVLSVLLSAIYFFPAYEMSRRSNRSGGLSYAEATQSSYPRRELGELILPLYTGDSIVDPMRENRREPPHGQYFGQWGERLVSDYLGIGIILLAIFGLLSRITPHKIFWVAVLLAVLELCTGKSSPLFALFFRIIPGFDHFRSPATIMFLIPFAAIYLALHALESLVDRHNIRRREHLQIALILPFFAVLLPLIVYFLKKEFLPGELVRENLLLNSALRTGLCCLLSTIIFAAALFVRKHPFDIALTALLVILIAFDLFLIDRNFIRGARVAELRQASARYQSLASYLNVTQKDRRPFRMLDLDNLLTNWPAMAGLDSLHGYHPVSYKKYTDLVAAHGFVNPTTARLFYLRLLVSRDPQNPALANYEPLHGFAGAVSAYQSKTPLRYAWFPQAVQAEDDSASVLRKIFEYDPYRISFTEEWEQGREFGPADNCFADVAEYQFDRVLLQCVADRPRPLIVAEYAAPGWRAILDRERELPIITANYFLRMVELPAGKHRLEFRYEPDSYRAGAFLSLLTIAAIALCGSFMFHKRIACATKPANPSALSTESASSS